MNIYIKSSIMFLIFSIATFFSISYNLSIYILLSFIIYLIWDYKNNIQFKKSFYIIISLFFITILIDIIGINIYRETLQKNTVYSCLYMKNKSSLSLSRIYNLFGNRELITEQIIKCKIKNGDYLLMENISKYQYSDYHGVKNSPNNFLAFISYNYLNDLYKINLNYEKDYIMNIYKFPLEKESLIKQIKYKIENK